MSKITNDVIIHPENPHYFLDQITGKPLLLMGTTAHLPQNLDFDASKAEQSISDDVKQWKNNHGRLWHFTPWALPAGKRMPWKRVRGYGKANDGFDKFDMNQ